MGPNDNYVCETSQAHPADLLNITKFININEIMIVSRILNLRCKADKIFKNEIY